MGSWYQRDRDGAYVFFNDKQQIIMGRLSRHRYQKECTGCKRIRRIREFYMKETSFVDGSEPTPTYRTAELCNKCRDIAIETMRKQIKEEEQ